MKSSAYRLVRNLASALLAGEWRATAMRERLAEALGQGPRWIRPLAGRAAAAFPDPPDLPRLIAFVDADDGFTRALSRSDRLRDPEKKLRVARQFWVPDRMGSSGVPGANDLPALATPGQLGDALGLSPNDLLWYADLRGLNPDAADAKLRHYSCRWVPKRSGGSRLLEIPKPRLKRAQRTILRKLLDPIPPHAAAHGFRPGRSVVTYAEPHCGRAVVLRFDLVDFFPSVPSGRVFGLFRSLGYPEAVARLLTGLCTSRLSAAEWAGRPHPKPDGADHATWQRLSGPHLPQGAPTSPALANLCAFRLDVRLAAFAKSLDATYTRYADDLAFSGGPEFLAASRRVRKTVTAIAAEEGFAANVTKHRVMTQGHRQQLAGVVVNVRPNVTRAEFDELKAILTNCRRHGPEGQNRANRPHFRHHLRGRVARVAGVNPTRGRTLAALFDAVAWPAAGAGLAMPADSP